MIKRSVVMSGAGMGESAVMVAVSISAFMAEGCAGVV
jgi:hypothetical protein